MDDGCYCHATVIPPCWWCTSHEAGCEWPDADCHCHGTTVAAPPPVFLPPLARIRNMPDLAELDALLDSLYDLDEAAPRA